MSKSPTLFNPFPKSKKFIYGLKSNKKMVFDYENQMSL